MRRRNNLFAIVPVAALLLACDLASAMSPEAADQPVSPQPGQPSPTQPASSGALSAGEPTPVPSSGRTYFVDPNGSDKNGGSEANPWQTIQHAADSVAPGDTILLQSGTYPGARIERSGTSDAWITLRAASGGSVLISQPGPNSEHESGLEFETWEADGVVAFWVIEGVEVANAPNWGIDVRGSEENHSHHFIVRGNNVHDNGLSSETTGIFFAFVDHVTVEGNESHSNGEHGIYLSNSGDHFVIRGNRLHDNANCGLHMNGDLSMGDDGTVSDGLVERNTIFENGVGGGSAINMDGVTDTIVRNNLLYQNHAGGISIFKEDGAVCSQNIQVLNNTIVMAEDGRWAINLSDTSCANNALFNNIIVSFHSWRGSIQIPAPGISGFESDYNVVLDRFSTNDGNSVITLAEWQTLGYDTHSIVATPADLFAGPNDYHLREGSPAIDAGVALPNVLFDLDDNPRDAAPDMGAYEWPGFRIFQPLALRNFGP